MLIQFLDPDRNDIYITRTYTSIYNKYCYIANEMRTKSVFYKYGRIEVYIYILRFVSR